MPYNLLLFPLLGGFWLIHHTHHFRFRAQRYDGYRLIFESAIAGTFLAAAAKLILLLTHHTRWGKFIASFWEQFAPWEHSGWSLLAFGFGLLIPPVWNRFVDLRKAKNREVKLHADALTSLLHHAESNESLISVTMDTRKWYVGFVAMSPNLSPQEMYFRILPVLSGYREKDSLRFIQTVSYQDVISFEEEDGIDPQQFVITLPLKDVKSANLFDIDIYQNYFLGIEAAEDDSEIFEELPNSSPVNDDSSSHAAS